MGPYAAVAGTWTTARRPPAALASFLVGEEAGFVSGQVIYVAGGPQD